MSKKPILTTAKVQLYCKELRRYKYTEHFTDSGGIAVGNDYNLGEFGDGPGPFVWTIRLILE